MATFWNVILSNSLLATALALGVVVAGRLWKNAAAVHVLWVVVLLKLFTPPVFNFEMPLGAAPDWIPELRTTLNNTDRKTGSVVPFEPTTVGPSLVADVDKTGADQAISSKGTTLLSQSQPTARSLSAWTWSQLLLAIWIVGALYVALVYSIQIWRFRRLFPDFGPPSTEIHDLVSQLSVRLGIKTIPKVSTTLATVPPLVWSFGFFPRLILPSRLLSRLGVTAQSTIVAHELVHVSRRDHLVRLLELAATTLFWWHPVVWWARRELRELEEECCDSRVVALMPQHSRSYATALVDTLDFLAESPRIHIPLPTAVQSTRSLSRRIQMLAERRSNRMGVFSGLIVAAIVAAPLLMTIAGEQKAKPQVDASKEKVAVTVLKGVITNTKGETLVGARVRVAVPAIDHRFFPDASHLVLETTTGDHGEYQLEIPGITHETTASMDVLQPKYRRLSGTLMQGGDGEDLKIKPGETREVSYTLKPAMYFSGVVVDQEGKPIPGVQVAANSNSQWRSGGVERTVSGDDGSFELFNYSEDQIKVDLYNNQGELIEKDGDTNRGYVDFFHPNYIDNKLEDAYTIQPEFRKGMRVVLPSGYKLSGSVLDDVGEPVEGAVVKITDSQGSNRKSALTDEHGTFVLRGLPVGPATLSTLALRIDQKSSLPVVVDRDKLNHVIRLESMKLPKDPQTVTILGMQLVDMTPEYKEAFDLYYSGAVILDPGLDSERLDIGDLQRGDSFFMVGDGQIKNVKEFVDRILEEAAKQDSPKYSIRVVYSLHRLEFDGTNTQYLKLTAKDIQELESVSEKLAKAAN